MVMVRGAMQKNDKESEKKVLSHITRPTRCCPFSLAQATAGLLACWLAGQARLVGLAALLHFWERAFFDSVGRCVHQSYGAVR